MPIPRMFYFGPWDKAGHHFFDENGRTVNDDRIPGFPFGHGGTGIPVDGCLQPGCRKNHRGRWTHQDNAEIEGESILHHIGGWTVLSFWDRSVDTRYACNSTYFAEGTFSFEQIVEMSKERFAARWNQMKFEVRLSDSKGGIMGRGRQHYEVYCKNQHLNPDWERLPQQVKDEWDKRAETANAAGDPPPEVPPIIPT